MGVVLLNPKTGKKTLYCKGADSNMFPRISRPKSQVYKLLAPSSKIFALRIFSRLRISIISPLKDKSYHQEEEALLESTKNHLDVYSQQGLRVLVMASRELGDPEYEDWLEQHKKAENALERREKLLMESYNSIENKMKLLGATGSNIFRATF